MLARGILGSGRTGSVSSWPFPNSSGWWWLISSVFLIRISCHKTTHANVYYCAWPGWAVSISVLPLTKCPLRSLAHFLLGIFVFWYWAAWAVCMFWRWILSGDLCLKYFSYSECCLFLLFRGSLAVKILLRLIPSFWPIFTYCYS